MSNTARYAYLSLRSLFPESIGKIGSMVVAYSSVTSFINTLRNVGGTLLASLFSRTKSELGEYVLRYTLPLHSPGRRVAKKGSCPPSHTIRRL